MAKTTAPPPIITREGNKVTIDLDQAADTVEDGAKVTLAFLRRLGEDGQRVANRVENYLRDRAARAKQEVRRGKR